MKQNLFMVAMYFFIPLKNPTDKDSMEFKPFLYDGDKFPNIRCGLEYCELEVGVTSKAELSTPNEKTIAVNLYLLHYSHPELHVNRFFVAIGTSIDKLFDETGFSKPDNQLLAKDIVLLKKAFMNNHVLVDNISVNEWIKNACNKKKIELFEDCFHFSVIDITSIKEAITDKMDMQELTRLFRDRFYAPEAVDEYCHVVDNCDRFAYGVLKGDTWFDSYTDNDILPFVQNSYYSKVFERIYVNPTGLVSIHTHCPSEKPCEKADTRMSHTIHDVFNIIECSVLFDAKMQINDLRKIGTTTNVDIINSQIKQIDKLLTVKAFLQEETDNQIDVLRRGMGLVDSAQSVTMSLETERQRIIDHKEELRDKLSKLAFIVTNIVTFVGAITTEQLLSKCLFGLVFLICMTFVVFLTYKPIKHISQ